MNTNNKSTAALVAKLNRQYRAYERFGKGKNLDAMPDKSLADHFAECDKLGAAFDKTLNELKERGEIVKFDGTTGEYYVGKDKYRVQLTVVSRGIIEVDAPSAQVAILKAKALAACDKIDLCEIASKFDNLAEEV